MRSYNARIAKKLGDPRFGLPQNRWFARAASLGIALALDAVLGEAPSKIHPVALYGKAMNVAEEILWTDTLGGGARYLGVGTGVALLAAWISRGFSGDVIGAYTALGRRSLIEHALAVKSSLELGDLGAARKSVAMIVGRDTEELDESRIAAAVIESLAESFNDAIAATLTYANFFGASGALVHRGVNTLDSMVGHRDLRYDRFGWASARLDDALGYVPARLGAAAIAMGAKGRWREVLSSAARQAKAHPSPNAGLLEATMAFKLGVSLGGELSYNHRVSQRPKFGPDRAPTTADIDRAIEAVNGATLRLAGAIITADIAIGLAKSIHLRVRNRAGS